MRRIKFLLVILTGLLLQIQTGWGQKGKFEAMYIYNICRYVEWPSGFVNGEFTIGMVGRNNELLSSLQTISQSRTIQGKKVVVKEIASPANAADCQILFFASGAEKNISNYVGSATNYLICSERSGNMPDGSDINFFITDSKLKFDFSESNVSKKALRVSTSLKQLASTVY